MWVPIKCRSLVVPLTYLINRFRNDIKSCFLTIGNTVPYSVNSLCSSVKKAGNSHANTCQYDKFCTKQSIPESYMTAQVHPTPITFGGISMELTYKIRF